MGVTSEALSNFPVLVKLTSSNIDYSKTQSAGQDIRFTDSSGNDLAYEIEKWDSTATSFVWVKVTSISINSSTDYMYMYFGNSSATDHQQATSVWSNSYVAVWHLKESGNGTSGEYKDSTSNAFNGQGGAGTSTKVPTLSSSGQVDGAQNFDGSDDYISDPTFTISGNQGSMETWVNVTDVTTYRDITKNTGNSAVGDFYFFINQTNGKVHGSLAGQAADSVSSVTNGVLTRVSVTYDGSKVRIYLNGTLDITQNVSNANFNFTGINIGIQSNGSTEPFKGIIDELRASNTVRSAAWIAASYKSETDAFNTYAAAEQIYSSTPGTLTSSIFDSGQGSDWGTLTYAATTPANTSVSVKVRTGNQSDLSDATSFTSCSAISSGSTVGGTTCATNNQRYVQYQLSLANTDSVSTPTFTSFSLAFTPSDTTPPSISLTALSPDPNSDNTPTLSGTATESIGTVSNVQFQMDSTSGSWSSCSASDGSFNSASEAFSCTAATLTDGSHTMYVRATDSNSNTTASGSYASDTFTIDATAPTSVDLDSPGDNNYTNSERPTFKWKATTDATAGLSKYVLEIDNPSLGSGQPSGDFTIDDIPTSRTTDYETNKYIIHYENFSDSDSTNNYISVYTKSSTEWSTDSNSGQNDGKLREGRVSWKVKARDNAGNETSSSRTLFVDRSGPKVEFTQVNDTPFSSTNFSTTDKTPTIFGKIIDPLAGGDSSPTQSDSGPKIASSPKQVDIKVEKKEGLGYKLHTLYTINMDKPWYSCDGKEISDNSKQKCDKYLPFEYTSKENLVLGTYKITLTGKDKADNSASETSFTLSITTLARITTPEEKKIIEEETKTLKPEEKEQIKQELEITKPTEEVPVSALQKAQTQISQTSKNILNTTGNIISSVFNGIGQGVRFAVDTTGKTLAFIGDKAGQALAFVGQGIGNGASAVGQGLAWTGGKIGQGVSYVAQGTGNMLASIGQGIGNTGKAIGDGYNQLANNAPGVTKTILTGIGNGVSATTSTIASAVNYTTDTTVKLAQHAGNFIAGVTNNIGKTTSSIAQNTTKTIGNIASSIAVTTSTIAKNTGSAASNAASAIASATQNGVSNAKKGIANLAFTIGEKTEDISHGVGTTIINIGYLFVPEPTKISDVNAVALSPTSVKITWTTNHPANGKVNWGYEDGIYEFEDQTDKRTIQHEFVLANLKPDTEYHYEVMSQNRNYVYDANRKFKTPPAK